MDPIATAVFVFFFALVTVLGFVAARWRRGDLTKLDEWGLGGRRFGTWVSWFLIGGDLYTAYTFIAVPALVFGAGAMGFFAVPYTILIYPFAFLVLPRLWNVSRRHGFVTPADFVRARYGSKSLALAIAATGILATMPYIALQLVGIQVVVAALGFPTQGFLGELPLWISFAILAAYTYSSGLRAPAMIAIVKDMLIYVTIIVSAIYIPYKLGGFSAVFAAIPPEKLLLKAPSGESLNQFSAYTTLAVGSALALFLYPHSVTAILSAKSGNTLRKNMVMLPAYSLLLGFIALLGYMAVASGVAQLPEYADYFKAYKNNFAVPALFMHMFPSWFVGIAFSAIAIGALVPAAIMSIAAANLFTRNIYREFIRPECSHAQETQVSKFVSLVMKFGALVFVFTLDTKSAIQFQLLGGVWIIQTLPALIFGLYTRWFDSRGLLLGWAVGIVFGTWVVAAQKFAGSTYVLDLGIKIPGYVALYALILNAGISAGATAVLRAMGSHGKAETIVESDFDDLPEAV